MRKFYLSLERDQSFLNNYWCYEDEIYALSTSFRQLDLMVQSDSRYDQYWRTLFREVGRSSCFLVVGTQRPPLGGAQNRHVELVLGCTLVLDYVDLELTI
jgi:hypothetical protein